MLKEHKNNYKATTPSDGLRSAGLPSALVPSYNVVPTPHNPDQDFFYYVNKEDEDEAFESLGYNPRCKGGVEEDDFRVNKFW